MELRLKFSSSKQPQAGHANLHLSGLQIQFIAKYKSKLESSVQVQALLSDVSDLMISTPSQTQSTVSNDAFEVLIDLLASEGIDENPSNLRGNHTRPQADVSLRDSSGKLDFDKIRLMFASQNAPNPLEEEKKRAQSAQSPTPPYDDEGDSDDDHYSHRSTSSTVPSRSNSISPKPIKHVNTGHKRSSTFGSQPWVAIHGNATKAKVVRGSCCVCQH